LLFGIGGFKDVNVGDKCIRVKKRYLWVSYRLNTIAMNFVGKYDQGISVMPLIIELTDKTFGFKV